MNNDYEWSWGNDAIDRIAKAFDLAGEIRRIEIVFHTGRFPQMIVSYDNGAEVSRTIGVYGIQQLHQVFDLGGGYQRMEIVMERDRFAYICLQFVPKDDPLGKIFNVLKQVESVPA